MDGDPLLDGWREAGVAVLIRGIAQAKLHFIYISDIPIRVLLS